MSTTATAAMVNFICTALNHIYSLRGLQSAHIMKTVCDKMTTSDNENLQQS